MDRKGIFHLKQHINSYLALSEEEFEPIAMRFKADFFIPKTLVQTPGEICRHEYFIVKGLFQHSYIAESGKEFTLSFPHENWWAGDFKSFKNEIPTDKSLEVLEPSQVMKIGRADFFYLLENSQVFERYIAKLSQNNSIKMQERVISDMSSNLEDRIHSFFQSYPELVSRLSQKRIASFLGVSQEHLSKVLNKRKDLPPINLS